MREEKIQKRVSCMSEKLRFKGDEILHSQKFEKGAIASNKIAD
jgi:hypothetical protein